MSNPATRQLRRRQLAVRHMLVDLAHTAYSRAHELGMQRNPAGPGGDSGQIARNIAGR